MASSLRTFVRAVLGVRDATMSDLTLEPDDDALPPQFVVALVAFAIVLSAIVTMVLVTSLQNG